MINSPIGAKPARMLITVTPAGPGGFFLKIGREAIDGETEPVSPTPEATQKPIQTASNYGLEFRMSVS